ncbi:MAG TPA: patatin-like phospholipase family protein [Aggregatilinea sp.]|uniref:patatin-like phospholipase family protein n=1 Tax=Aggregatilinea sp. TaxID=2806333 RepID=UPI002CB8B627|nr:patatin-like phospholipase family protein [Aggregatilinea sp.]HML22410.1 patatin-like phospholipase family protein [Aggregatilinea sp.]
MSHWWTGMGRRTLERVRPLRKPEPGRPVLGLALSGGGERGVAHIGVLSVLEEHGIRADVVAGTSAGSIAGALYCAGWSSGQMLDAVHAMNLRQIRRFSWSDRRGILRSEAIEDWVGAMLGPGRTFADLDIPLTVIAADLLKGTEILFDDGPLAPAIRASCAVPGMFTPCVDADGRVLVDGGLVNNLPVDIVRQMGATFAIGVDVSHHGMENWPDEPPRTMIDVLSMVYYVLRHNTDLLHHEPDCLVIPTLPSIRMSKVVEYADQLYEAGRDAMLAALPRLMDDLENTPAPHSE